MRSIFTRKSKHLLYTIRKCERKT